MHSIFTVDNYTSNTVAFLPSIHDNGKFLSCRADNPLLSDSSLEDGWTLNIHCKHIMFNDFPIDIDIYIYRTKDTCLQLP